MAEASSNEVRDILTGFNAYFGTYEIEEASDTVIHHVQGSLIPSWVGADLRRKYEFSETNRLVLSAISSASTNRLMWERDV